MTDVNQLITEHLDIWTSAIVEKSSTGRGNSRGVELYGVKKLRELIRQLAVHGKLVAQVCSDGHADVVLRDIEVERARLIKSKHYSKPRAINENQMVSGHSSIPRTWLQVPLTEVYLSISPSKNKLKKTEFSESGEYPIVDQGQEFVSGYTDRDDLVISIPHPIIVFGDHTRNIKYIDFDFVAGADGTKILCPLALLPRYFALFLESLDLESKGYSRHFKILNSHYFNLPPLAEQHRIVAKVDELMALCDALERQAEDSLKAHQTLVETCLATLTNSQSPEELTENWARIEAHFDALFTTEESILALEKVIIQLGVSGLLRTHNPSDEPAESILKEIKGRHPKVNKGKRFGLRGQVSLDQSNGLKVELPEGWELVEFSELIEPSKPISYGVLVPGKDTDGGVPFARIADLSIDDPAELPEKSISQKVDDQYARTRLEGGEILMGVVGSIGKLGVAPASWRGANIARAVCRIVPAQELSKDFVLLLLRSKMMQERFRGDTRVLAQPTLNIGLIRSAPTPLPPLAEQHRIVDRVEELLKVSAALRSSIETSQKTSLLLADTLTSKFH